MTRISAMFVTVLALSPFAGAAEVSLGALGGGQLLETTSKGLSHGRLVNEVTLGRTLLAGVLLDLGMDRRHHLTAELAIGPYHGDVDRYCLSDVGRPDECKPPLPLVSAATSHALLYGLQYTLRFRLQGHRPFVGCGLGAKRYSYDESGDPYAYEYEHRTSLTLHAAIGFELAARTPVRLEARGVLVRNNPYLVPGRDLGRETDQLELQIRASVRFRLSR